ncbi:MULTISPECIES: Maf family protein [Bacillus]|uniref:Maf family protein n=1 Tax=Bacillus TaxID=1386 RepID=UPI00031EC246|nr:MULTISPECIES: Maf family protein [Bacillus]
MTSLILASASPRRKELLTLLDIPFLSYSTDIDETILPNTAPEEAVQQLAYKKAYAALQTHSQAIIIGCDTIVVHNGNILGKPKDAEDAINTLSQLSGHTHSVLTGVSIMTKDSSICFYEKTEVTFWELTQQDILTYIDSGEPFDKAGSYGIQGKAALFVKGIQGDYYNVVGLPVSRLARELSQFR